MAHRLCPKCGRTIFGIQTYCLTCTQGKGITGFFRRLYARLTHKKGYFEI
jgi:hypothetical protein